MLIVLYAALAALLLPRVSVYINARPGARAGRHRYLAIRDAGSRLSSPRDRFRLSRAVLTCLEVALRRASSSG